jgi:hypothetical protein
LAGIDGMQMATTTNMFEWVTLVAASRRATELREEALERLAALITNKIAEAWNKGQKG